MRTVKLDKKGVAQYEKMSGFKTTGDVKIVFSEPDVFHEYLKLLSLEGRK